MDTMTSNTITFSPEQDEALAALDSDEDLSSDTAANATEPAASATEPAASAPEPAANATEPAASAPAPAKPEPRQERQPSYSVPAEKLGEVSAKLGEIDAARDDLAKKYEDGEIDFREYDRKSRELADARIELQTEHIKANVYSDMERQQQRTSWDAAVKTFYADEANAAFSQPSLQSLLAAELKAMWERPEVAGRDYLSVLNDAKTAVQSQLRAALGMEAKQPGAKRAEATRPPALESTDIPKTLGAIPTARANETGGEFAHLDALNEIDLESEMHRMTRGQIDRYLAA